MHKEELLEQYLQDGQTIKAHKLMMESVNDLISNITTVDLLKLKEHPNQLNIKEMVEYYEEHSQLLIKLIVALIRYSNPDFYEETILEILDKFLKKKANEVDGYGYIWNHLSNYPLLLVSYATNIMLMKRENYKFLYKIMHIPYRQKYMGRDIMESIEISLPEAMNCYHLFHNIDYINVDIYQFLPSNESNVRSTSRHLEVNNRVFNYLTKPMTVYFANEADFAEYFDLYEYFLGLFIMSQRLARYDNLPNRQIGEFAPYGRRYWMYSGSGMYFSNTDTIVHKFIAANEDGTNDILKANFFSGNRKNLEVANTYYKDLLDRLTRY